ncbi:hypothetical protein ASF92_19595 [Pedobacter sp. Leaf176]|nr:hypothetical protein ASF92_19595 [Pedobacter sp. Leaf176]
MEAAYISNLKSWHLLNDLKSYLKGEAANPYAGLLEIRCLDKLKSCGLISKFCCAINLQFWTVKWFLRKNSRGVRRGGT